MYTWKKTIFRILSTHDENLMTQPLQWLLSMCTPIIAPIALSNNLALSLCLLGPQPSWDTGWLSHVVTMGGTVEYLVQSETIKSEQGGITFSKCLKQVIANSEFYTQQKYPSKNEGEIKTFQTKAGDNSPLLDQHQRK